MGGGGGGHCCPLTYALWPQWRGRWVEEGSGEEGKVGWEGKVEVGGGEGGVGGGEGGWEEGKVGVDGGECEVREDRKRTVIWSHNTCDH